MENLNEKQQARLAEINDKIIWGLKNKKVFLYPDVLFDRLRPYSIGGLPISIMLFVPELCNGHCYDRSVLMSLAFQNCKVVHADIESLRLTAGEELAEHSFVETPEFGAGKSWVVDTSIGLIYDKDFYYELEKPKVNREISKKSCMQSPDIIGILASNYEDEKYSLPMLLPLVENLVKNSDNLPTCIYKDKLEDEIIKLKQAVNYDALVREIQEDMQMIKTDPAKLDEKFGIVRDKFGNEMGRNGKINPYYISPEELITHESDSFDDKFFIELYGKHRKAKLEEESQTYKKAKNRLKKIKKNPTQNVYTSQPNNE